MLIEALVTAVGLSAGLGGAVAVWQRRLQRAAPPPPDPTTEAAPYRAQVQPAAARDGETGGYPAPPPFDD